MRKSLNPTSLLVVLTGLNLFNYIDRYVLSSVLEQIKNEFQFDDAAGGWLATAFMLGYFITCPFFGYLGDRMKRKYLIAGGIFVWSLATVLTGFASDYWHLIVYRVLIGVGEASYATLAPGLISDTFQPKKRNNAFTIFYSAIPIGAAMGVLLGSHIGSNYGWHNAFIWVGAPGLVFALSLLPFREPERGESEGKALDPEYLKKPGLKDIWKVLWIRDYALCVWGYVAYTFALGAYAHWAPSFLTRVHGMTQTAAGEFFGLVMTVAGLFGTFLGGFAATALQKRISNGYAWSLTFSSGVAVPLLFVMLNSTDLFVVQTSFAVAVFCLFLSTGPVNTLCIEAVPPNVRASAMAGQIFLIHAFGDVWSPYIVGHISASAGDNLVLGLKITPWALTVATGFWAYLTYVQGKRRNPLAAI
jgi:MFS family permease